jgi:hypothetical protein
VASVNVTLSIPDDSRFDEVIRVAENHGLKVAKAFRPLGVATGAVDEAKLAILRTVPGIGSVEAERIYHPDHLA